VDDLSHAGHPELPAGGHPPHARALPPARARAAAALVGRAVRPQPRLQPDPRQDRGRELPRQRRLGHLRLQGRADRGQDPRRARRHRAHEDRLVSELAAAAVSH
jgi:hypothetical protein